MHAGSVVAFCVAIALPSVAGANALLEQGRAAVDARDFDRAAEVLARALTAAPRDADIQHWLGRAELMRGNVERGRELLEQAVRAKPNAADFHYWHAESIVAGMGDAGRLAQLRMAGRMRDAWQKAVELDPNHVQARRSLTMYYLRAPAIAGGGRDKALAEVAAIRRLDPVQGHRAMAAVHMADQKWDDARLELEHALAVPGADPEISLEYGFLCQRTEDWNCAFGAFSGIPADHPAFRMAQYQVGRTAVLSGDRLGEGVDALLGYLDHAPRRGMPSKAWAHVRLGQVYEKQGRRDEARAQYRAALELEPNHEEAQRALRSLHNGA